MHFQPITKREAIFKGCRASSSFCRILNFLNRKKQTCHFLNRVKIFFWIIIIVSWTIIYKNLILVRGTNMLYCTLRMASYFFLSKFCSNFKNLDENMPKNCAKILGYHRQSDEDKLLSNMYIECGRSTVQVNIFYERNKFSWIGDDSHVTTHKKLFGDTPRAVNK